MRFEKYRVNFNSEEFIEFLADKNTADKEDVERALESFKKTEEYLDNSWDEEMVFDHLIEEGIVLIPISQIETKYTLELPELNID